MNGDVDTDLLPTPSGQRDLGNASKTWKEVHATSFHGDGSNLSNTGATLNTPASGTNRLVTTSLTSGTMTTASTDSGLTFDHNSNTLSVGGDIIAFSGSDRNLKDNIVAIPNALDKVKAISGNTFTWKSTSAADTGVIAQEIEALGLAGITTTRDDGTKAVRYDKLIPVLIEAVKELSAKVDDLS